jgi:ketosteroid isomerase-like protein
LRTLEERIQELEDRTAIGELIARYGFRIDDRDIEAVADLFTEDATLRSSDGVQNAVGRDAVLANLHGRFTALGPSNHTTHDREIIFDPSDPDRATGLVVSHAEMTRHGQARVACIRYYDEYRRCADGKWRFRSRLLSFFYFTDPRELGQTLEEVNRVKAEATPTAAGWPENLETWQRYYREHPRP